MGTRSENLRGILGTYNSRARSRHALAVHKLEDLYRVLYGLYRLDNAVTAIGTDTGGVKLLADDRAFDEIYVWLEFILLRFEMHTGDDEGDFGYQEYASELSDDEKVEFLEARKLRRRHIQHLSPKWLRENTFVLEAIEEADTEQAGIGFEVGLRGAGGERTSFSFELPQGRKIRLPFFISGGLTINCIDWKVFSDGVRKVIACLERDIPELQAMMIAEINSMSKHEREEILIQIQKPNGRME